MAVDAVPVSSGDITSPQFPPRSMIDSQDTHYLALIVQVKYDAV